ncbi:MAG: hypothetical protein MZV64_45610 [Ignavibacteriales bacterium]|nr:hypothetical protein [Ignavibacteriales bacterium]
MEYLKSLGAKGSSIIKIFFYQGIYLSAIGIIAGNILAWFLMFLQLELDIIKVPSSVYFVTRVPIELSAGCISVSFNSNFYFSFISGCYPELFCFKNQSGFSFEV